jgi:cytochrome o ubiquinol oxidase subunit 2
MLIVVIPVFVMTFLFAWRYRASNTKARYTPDWTYSVAVDAVVWLVPAAIVIALGTLLWRNTHKLDPYRPIDPSVQPLQVEVSRRTGSGCSSTPRRESRSSTNWYFPAGRR